MLYLHRRRHLEAVGTHGGSNTCRSRWYSGSTDCTRRCPLHTRLHLNKGRKRLMLRKNFIYDLTSRRWMRYTLLFCLLAARQVQICQYMYVIYIWICKKPSTVESGVYFSCSINLSTSEEIELLILILRE